MSGKEILAVIFAGLILLKIVFGLINPGTWMGISAAFLGHYTLVLGLYLGLLVITGYYIFTSLDLIDVAVVMLFTSTLVGITLIPYAGSMIKMGEEIGVLGFGKAWLGLLLWVAIAGAVLYRVFASKAEQ
ncbi:MAG TPA: hypothetical protein VE082_07425 [Desulfobaccales bacterium]|nr:hypothetical protein [Desulfobaccales bacterium]